MTLSRAPNKRYMSHDDISICFVASQLYRGSQLSEFCQANHHHLCFPAQPVDRQSPLGARSQHTTPKQHLQECGPECSKKGKESSKHVPKQRFEATFSNHNRKPFPIIRGVVRHAQISPTSLLMKSYIQKCQKRFSLSATNAAIKLAVCSEVSA